MAYRIISLERIAGDSLPVPLRAGVARWHATVEFWDGDPRGAAQLTDDFVFERPTQLMRSKGGDEWELVSKEETLTTWLTEMVERHEPHYLEQIRTGVRGFRGDPRPDQHGEVVGGDSIAHNPKVRELVGVVRQKLDSKIEGGK